MLELGVGMGCLTSLGVNCNSSNCKNKLVLWYICLFICISIIAFKYIDRYINIECLKIPMFYFVSSKIKFSVNLANLSMFKKEKKKRLIKFVKL